MSSDNIFSQSPLGEEDEMEQRLWPYLDGTADQEEQSLIQRLVAEDAAWKAKYQELLSLKTMMQDAELEQPSMRFTKNVMEEIAKLHVAPAAKKYINNRIIWGIGFFFIALLVGTLVYGIGEMFSTPGEASRFSKKIENVDFSRFFNNNVVNALMMVNVVIGLFLFDNYLSNQRKKFRKEAE
jgi:hypothetical protein